MLKSLQSRVCTPDFDKDKLGRAFGTAEKTYVTIQGHDSSQSPSQMHCNHDTIHLVSEANSNVLFLSRCFARKLMAMVSKNTKRRHRINSVSETSARLLSNLYVYTCKLIEGTRAIGVSWDCAIRHALIKESSRVISDTVILHPHAL